MRHRSSSLRSTLVAGALSLGLGAAASAEALEWRVVLIGDAPPAAPAQLTFETDGGLSGTTGCNLFSGAGRLDASTLVIERPLATTRMACPGEAVTRQEDRMLAVLSGRVDLVYDPFASTLTLIGAKATMVLEAVPPKVGPEIPPTHAGREPPEGDPPYVSAFGRADDLPLHATPSADAEVVGRAWLGQVLRNAGCTDAGVWCDVSAIDGSIAGWAEAESLEPAGGALRAGQSVFDAAGSIPCAQGAGAPMTPCAFGVAREGAGTATVVVTKPDGVPRVLYFNDGAFTGPDTSEAGGGFESSVSREADLNFIRVDDERYEVPDAVMFGG